MNEAQKQAIDDTKKLIDDMTAAGWQVIGIGSVHGHEHDGAKTTFTTITVQKNQAQDSQGAVPVP